MTREQIEASLADPDGAYQRLRTLMNAWCALWFWPLTEFETAPPTLDEWLDACQMILGTPDLNKRRGQVESFASAGAWGELNQAEELDREFASARPMREVWAAHPWLGVCDEIATAQGFFHWELDFATAFAGGGFSLQVGNPPWVRPDVSLDLLLAEGDPWWALAAKPDEVDKAERRPATLSVGSTWHSVIDGASQASVLGDVISDPTMYAPLSGRPDLYRAFMAQVWRHSSMAGISGLIHMETHFTDDRATTVREEAYLRLRRHWQFANELKLFEIEHYKRFGINIYALPNQVNFLHGTNLFHPDTVTRSFKHDGSGEEPAFRNSDGRWDLRPHGSRIQLVDHTTLARWADLFDAKNAESAPMLFTSPVAERVLIRLSDTARIGQLKMQYSTGWNQTTDHKGGAFEDEWGEADWQRAILQGSHIFVSTPLAKSPNMTLKNNRDWTRTDYEAMPPNAIPVTAFKPAGDPASYDANYTHWGDARTPARDHYRVAWRRMAANTGERTLIPALIPPGAAHVHPVTSAGLPDRPLRDLAAVQAVLSSLLADFAIRSAPKSDIHGTTINRLPMVPMDHELLPRLILRTLRLNCVTEAYADLWAACWDEAFLDDAPILPRYDERPIGPEWTSATPLRRAADRRNAQVEIDALVALMLNVPIEDLCTIYRTQFAVLHGYDQRDYTYDTNGRLVPNSVRSLWHKLGEPQDPSKMPAPVRTSPHPDSGRVYMYTLPFTVFDREEDFRICAAEWRSYPQTPSNGATLPVAQFQQEGVRLSGRNGRRRE